ncbi:hypothetical 21.7 kda protein in syrb 5'region (orf4) (plasmid) [Sinorhizobium meliloti SM11]|uniref:Hypothetical 21.7 kDa protein in syrb 5'region (Orf4) n=1 Tax=Sinorhizobium meliloti (strain SM11) TaxID=707241 RepID=F7XE11_SINMM|nr:hypothetical 21.7 kda protein in syrb 5'region (orf4) [Sinorhizobium meliloti SM11]
MSAQQAFAPIQLNGGEGFPPSEDDAGALIGVPPSSRKFESLQHFLQLNVLQMKLLSELGPQHFDFFVECRQFMEKQVT